MPKKGRASEKSGLPAHLEDQRSKVTLNNNAPINVIKIIQIDIIG